MHRVVALALPDVVAFDLAIPAQVFGHVEQRGEYEFTTCSPVPGLVPTTTGPAFHVDVGLQALDTADTVVVPGYAPLRRPPGAAALLALRAAAERGARIMSVCTGAFALAAAGLLDGARAATHWQFAEQLRSITRPSGWTSTCCSSTTAP